MNSIAGEAAEGLLAGDLANFAGRILVDDFPSPGAAAWSSSSARLLGREPVLTVRYAAAMQAYAKVFGAGGTPELRMYVVAQLQAVVDEARRVLPPLEAAAVQKRLAEQAVRVAGGPEALREYAQALRNDAARRSLEQLVTIAARRASRPIADTVDAVLRTLDDALLGRYLGTPLEAGAQQLTRLLRTVLPTDAGWVRLGERLAAQRPAAAALGDVRAKGGAVGYGWSAFREHPVLARVAGTLQGQLGEMWLLRSRAWRLRERALIQTGLRRGRRLAGGGEPLVPIVIREPLLLNGAELYDGAVFLGRPLSSGGQTQVFEAYLHATAQVQIRAEVSLLDVLAKDVWREAKPGASVHLRTRDFTKSFILHKEPDPAAVTRYIVAPEIGTGTTRAAGGATVKFLPTLQSRDEFRDAAFHLLAGVAQPVR